MAGNGFRKQVAQRRPIGERDRIRLSESRVYSHSQYLCRRFVEVRDGALIIAAKDAGRNTAEHVFGVAFQTGGTVALLRVQVLEFFFFGFQFGDDLLECLDGKVNRLAFVGVGDVSGKSFAFDLLIRFHRDLKQHDRHRKSGDNT